MKTFVLTVFLQLIVTTFCFANDSLKVKKIEYWEDEKVILTVYIDSNRTTWYRIHHDFVEFDSETKQNQIEILQFKGNNQTTSMTLWGKIKNESTKFISQFVGSYNKFFYDNEGELRKIAIYTMNLPENKMNKWISRDLINNLPFEYKLSGEVINSFDAKGNIVKRMIHNNNGSIDSILVDYDSLNRRRKEVRYSEMFDFSKKKVIETRRYDSLNVLKTEAKFIYDTIRRIEITKCVYKENEVMEFLTYKINDILTNKIIKKKHFNELKKLESEEFYFQIIKDGKEIGEPILQSKTSNMYENDRLVKIIYENFINKSKRNQELKYTFW